MIQRIGAAILGLGLLATPAFSQSGTVAPVPLPTFFNASGIVCASCQLETYAAGTSTPLATYSDSALTTPHANPIILNSVGRPPFPIYLSATSYKFILKTSGGATIYTADNVSAVPSNITGVSSTADILFQVDTDNNGTNIFSFLNGTTVQKASIDEDGDAQFDGNLVLGDATAADKQLTIDGSAQDFYICLDDSAADLVIGNGSTCGTTPAITIDESENVFLPNVSSVLTFSGATAPEIHFSAQNALISSNDSVNVRLDKNNNGSHTFNVLDGGGTNAFSLTEAGSVTTGTVEVTTVAPGSPDKETQYADSIVKAWAFVTNSGTPTITDDYNVASLTDHGTGDVTVTFATAIGAATFACSVTAEGGTNPYAHIVSKASGSVRIKTYDTNFGTLADVNFSVICVGE